MADMGMPKLILAILFLPILLVCAVAFVSPKTPGGDAEPAVRAETLVAQKTEKKAVKEPEKKTVDVSPLEDLMREHGLLQRAILIYGEVAKRLESGKEFPPETLVATADIIRNFIENYHEKLEEDHLFPLFEKAGQKTDLVKVLREQHAAGRRVTDEIKSKATAAALKNPDERKKFSALLFAFIRMYRSHAAREDTVVFPAVHALVTPGEFDKLGDTFEDKETELFGQGGFEKQVGRIAELEKTLGISDLAQFTPRVDEKNRKSESFAAPKNVDKKNPK